MTNTTDKMLKYIVLSMKELCENLKLSSDEDRVKVNTDAIKTLSEAYAIIFNIQNGEQQCK